MNDEKTVPFNESLRNRCTCSSDIPPKLILGRWTMVEDASHNLTGSPEKEEIVHTGAPMKLSRGGDRDRAGLVEKKKKQEEKKKKKRLKKGKKKKRNEEKYATKTSTGVSCRRKSWIFDRVGQTIRPDERAKRERDRIGRERLPLGEESLPERYPGSWKAGASDSRLSTPTTPSPMSQQSRPRLLRCRGSSVFGQP